MKQEQQIDCIVDYDVVVYDEPLRVEECHGNHYFDDSTYEVNVNKVYLDFAGVRIDITDRLRAEEIKAIEDNIEPSNIN